MFKTPAWDDDVPRTHISFTKPIEKNKKKDKTEVKVKNILINVNKTKSKKPTFDKNQLPRVKRIYPKDNKEDRSGTHSSSRTSRPPKTKHNDSTNQNHNIGRKTSTIGHASSTNSTNKTRRKHKLDTKLVNVKKENVMHTEDTQNFDELLLDAKKKKFYEVIENEDKEELLFSESKEKKKNKKGEKNNLDNSTTVTNGIGFSVNSKKNRLKSLMNTVSHRTHINVGNRSSQLRERMLERLKAAQFRYLNEKLYTSSGPDAQKLFQEDPAAFETYHQGYQLQVKKWPVNPLDVIVKRIMKMPKSHFIADMGCGEAALSKRIPHTVRSFDLVASSPAVEACDMARTPLLTASVDTAVYCLALMGTDLTKYLVEANRVLKIGGHLLIAEVESRFDNVDNFTKEVERLGFKLKQLDKGNKVFFFIEFIKVREPPVKKAKLPALTLKPCLYKRR